MKATISKASACTGDSPQCDNAKLLKNVKLNRVGCKESEVSKPLLSGIENGTIEESLSLIEENKLGKFIFLRCKYKWGENIFIIDMCGNCGCRLSKNKEDDFYFISDVYVNEDKRKNGYGNDILKYVESFGKKFELKVIFDSWKHEWYKRHGYIDFGHKLCNGFIYMRKQIAK